MAENFSSADIVAVTKSAISQLIGKGYMDAADGEFTELDDHLIVDLGEKLELTEDGDFAPNTAPDIMFKALLSQCGKIVIDKRTYVAKLPKLFVVGILHAAPQYHPTDLQRHPVRHPLPRPHRPTGYMPLGTSCRIQNGKAVQTVVLFLSSFFVAVYL